MSLSLRKLRELKERALPLSTILVKVFLDENGTAPIGVIADACGISIRSVERSLASLKRLGLLPTNLSHDHDHGHGDHEGTATALSVDEPQGGLSSDKPVDPLEANLLEHEVLPWCVDTLMDKVEREVLKRQLDYHAFRLASGFKFKGHPARYLFSACLHDYAPPEGYHANQYKTAHGIPLAPKVETYVAPAKPASDEPLSHEKKVETLRAMLAKPMPASKRLAQKLAGEWGINLLDLGVG